jgi:hypothetical protein
MSTMRFRTNWLACLLRGRRLDRNPLRRGSDRAETIVLGALLAGFLAAAPFAAPAAGAWGHDSTARQAQAQRASLVQVTATLLRSGERPSTVAGRRPYPGAEPALISDAADPARRNKPPALGLVKLLDHAVSHGSTLASWPG